MMPSKTFSAGKSYVRDGLTAAFVCAYPLVGLTVKGGASALMIAAMLVSLYALMFSPCTSPALSRVDERDVKLTCIALASPLCATLASELWHRNLVFNLLDAPWRFLAAVPIMLFLRRMPVRAIRWTDCSFAIAAIGALAAGLMAAGLMAVEQGARLRLWFLDSIHYGDMALVVGLMSGLSIDWWQKDRLAVRALKITGLLAGLCASVLSGSRGGWLAVPVVAALVVYVHGKGRSRRWRMSVLVALLIALIGICVVSHEVRERLFSVWSDIVQYSRGHKDTSTGIRLQLYEVALRLTWQYPVFGAGPNGFAHAMPMLQRSGVITPTAALYGHGETHNQLLAYTANYGFVGGLAGIAIHLFPGWFFARRLAAPANPVRRTALLGLTFVVSFFIFGLTVETFDLKMVASYYSAVVAILVGILISPAASRAAPHGNQSPCSAS